MMKRVGNDSVRFETSRLKLHRQSAAIRGVFDLRVTGQREATGKAVLVDPAESRIRLFHDPGMLSYDFSRYSVVNPPREGTEFEPARGKTLKEIVKEEGNNIVFANNGQTDNMWCTNSVVVADGQVIKRTAPGVLSPHFMPLNGTFPFLVLDAKRFGLTTLPFSQGEPSGAITFKNGIYGPMLIRNGREVTDQIKQAQPNTSPNEILWNPATNQAAMSAAGVTINGTLIFLSLAGNPDKGNECNLSDIVSLLKRFSTTHAILLGISGDVQQYVRLGKNDHSWLIARARAGSSMTRMFPDARPQSNAIIVEERI